MRRKKGAVELAARYSRLDMDDSALDRGRAQTTTLGANWYLNQNVRLMIKDAHSTLKDRPLVDDMNGDLVAAKSQLKF